MTCVCHDAKNLLAINDRVVVRREAYWTAERTTLELSNLRNTDRYRIADAAELILLMLKYLR